MTLPPIVRRAFIAVSAAVLGSSCRPHFDAGVHPDWSEGYVEVAQHAWLYAQMSHNAYRPALEFVLPDSVGFYERFTDHEI
jgi:hypothetical protein